MKNTCFAAVAVPALAMAFCFATACTNEPGAVLPAGTGTVVGGTGYGEGSGGSTGSTNGGSGGGTESPPADAGLANTPSPGNGGDDANAPRPGPEGGTGSGGQHDSGSGSGGFGVDGQVPVIDSGSGVSGPLGSCTNPACGSDGNECGCQATDSNGNTVQLGCQAGGQCACFVNGNQVTDAFDENGVCSETPLAEAQMFLQYCGGNCD